MIEPAARLNDPGSGDIEHIDERVEIRFHVALAAPVRGQLTPHRLAIRARRHTPIQRQCTDQSKAPPRGGLRPERARTWLAGASVGDRETKPVVTAIAELNAEAGSGVEDSVGR